MVKVIAEKAMKDGEEKIKTSVEVSGYGGDLIDEATAAIEAIAESIVTEDAGLARAFKAGMMLRIVNFFADGGKEKN